MIYHFDKIYTGIITSPSIIWTPALVMDLWYQGMFELAVSEVVDQMRYIDETIRAGCCRRKRPCTTMPIRRWMLLLYDRQQQ